MPQACLYNIRKYVCKYVYMDFKQLIVQQMNWLKQLNNPSTHTKDSHVSGLLLGYRDLYACTLERVDPLFLRSPQFGMKHTKNMTFLAAVMDGSTSLVSTSNKYGAGGEAVQYPKLKWILLIFSNLTWFLQQDHNICMSVTLKKRKSFAAKVLWERNYISVLVWFCNVYHFFPFNMYY